MKQIGVLSSLLLLSLVGSYLTWTAEDGPKDESAVPMYQAAADDLTQIAWSAEDLKVVVERREDARGKYAWVTVTETMKLPKLPPPPDPNDTDADPVPPALEFESKTESTSFLGNAAADDLYKAFAPLYALRELAGADPASASFGLDAPKATLTVTRRSGPLELQIGGETWGTKDQYVRLGDQVFLVGAENLRSLKAAKTKLAERALQPAKPDEIEAVVLRTPKGEATFLQANRSDAAKAYWGRVETPTVADDAAASFIEKLERLRSQAYADEAAVGALTPKFAYAVRAKGETWQVEVLATAQEPVDYYAKAEYARGLVKLTRSTAADVAADVDAVLVPAPAGSEEAPADAPEGAANAGGEAP